MDTSRIAALFVETNGTDFGLPDVDPWDEARDARLYRGPDPVVAHPPCERWGRFWHGSTRKPHQFKLGDDGGDASNRVECGAQLGRGIGASRATPSHGTHSDWRGRPGCGH